jgi:transposase
MVKEIQDVRKRRDKFCFKLPLWWARGWVMNTVRQWCMGACRGTEAWLLAVLLAPGLDQRQ